MDIEVKPDNWILDNRIGYSKNTYETFNRKKYPDLKQSVGCSCTDNVCEEDIKTIKLFPHQRILRDYIQFDSPYRGILAYHELGSGKSAASIAAAEGFIEKRKIFVMTPASLAKNYENELMKISTLGLNMKKSWTLIKITGMGKSKKLIEKLKSYGISQKFIKKDNLVWIPLYKNDIDEDVIIVKNKVSYKSIDKEDKNRIEETILHIIKNRYNFISYNGLTQKMLSEMDNKIFDDSFVIVDEIHNFISRIVNGSKLARTIYNKLMEAKNCKLVLLSGTPIINKPYEIATLINLLRGPMNVNNFKLLSNSKEPSIESIKELLKDYEKYIDYIYYKNRVISIILLPDGYLRDNKSIKIKKTKWEYSEDKLLENIKNKLNETKDILVGAKVSKEDYYALPNNELEFNNLFIDKTDVDNLKIMNEDLFQRRILGTVSYYRTSGTELFPELLPINIQYLKMTDHQLAIYDEVREKERKIEDSADLSKRINPLDEPSDVYRAFSRMVCNFSFPQEIKRIFPQDIRKALKNEIDITNDNEDEEVKPVKKEDKDKKVMIEYENILNKAIKELQSGDYLSNENLRKYYSPKYYKMLIDIEVSPGKVLIYSQFRTVEGLGIFSSVLNYNNYKEIIISRNGNEFVFDDLSVFNEEYDDKRYIVFSNDKEKTNNLMHLYNGELALLDDNLFNSLPDRIKYNEDIQLYGKIIKIMMITQSGAEGISLKNVRRVLVMEYFWNSVRINQVIGRAVRTCSHELLPKKDRNVEVFLYIMRLSNEQLKKNFTIKTLDSGLTSDEFIYRRAKTKENLIDNFLKLLKSASFDCIINSEKNKPLESGYKCYNWPINVNMNKLSYTKNISEDYKILRHNKFRKIKKAKGKAVLIRNSKYVEIDNKYYDYNSYINAGVLLPVVI